MRPSVAFCRNRAGQRIAYMTWGQGPVLVMPPGWVSHLELQWHYLGMESFGARLAESFTLVSYDRRGCGLSDRERDEFTLSTELADLEAVIDEVAPGAEVALFGFSQAGPVTVAFAAAQPERVRRLMLFGTYHRGELVARPDVRESLVALVHASWGIGSHALASVFVPGDDPEFHANLVRFQRDATDRTMAAALLESGYRYDVADMLGDVRAPTLVIHRRDDRATSSRLGLEVAKGIAGARMVMLDGDIHFPWLGDWEVVAELVEDFALAHAERRPPSMVRELAPKRSPQPLHHLVHYRVDAEPERSAYRIALAQIGEPADLPMPGRNDVYRLPDGRVDVLGRKITAFVERAVDQGAELVVFPEMSIDLNHAALEQLVLALAREKQLVLVLGGYHEEASRSNVCVVVGPEGILWRQRKHIPALVRAGDQWIDEPIQTPASRVSVVAATHLGRIAVATCRDFLDLDLRVALRNSEPPVDLVLNPAFTPVTADFQAAHFEARRALYACTVFCNFATFGDSRIESPDKQTRSVHVPPGEERVEVAEVPLFAMRAERSAWDAQARRRFLQSTRH